MSFGYNLTPLNSFGFANGYAYPGLTAASYGYGLGASYLSPYGFYPPPPPAAPLTPTADFITVTPSPAPPQSPAAEYKSQVEQNILNSTEPIQTNETSTVNANGTQGIYLNKFEADKWFGDFPITEYKLNEDFFPQFIYKQSKPVHLIKSHSIKYLKPPAAPAPGDIVIKQEANIPTAPAPPVIIRQVPLKCCSPEPLVIREKPPCPPAQVCKKEIIIPGKKLPAPARKLVVERLAPVPVKPQPVLVERWLPYQKQERRVIFKQAPPDPIPEKPKNLIIQWHPPCVCVKEQYKNLGIEAANPAEYVAKYGSQLRNKCELPKFALDMKPTGKSFWSVNFFFLAFKDI